MINLFLIIKNSHYDPIFEGNLHHFEDVFFSFPDNSSIEQKLNIIRGWVKDRNYHLEIKDVSKIQA